MNRIAVAASAVLGLGFAGAALAQTPPPPKPTSEQTQPSQTRPDARYPNPSGQDSKPNETPPPKSAEDKAQVPHPGNIDRSSAEADKKRPANDAYTGSTGKKPDPSTVCSTPTDAASAHDQSNEPARKPQSRDKVCTTSGGDSATRPHAQDKAPEK
ncbi:MAG TPA: hypothetical protein VG994_16085 [Steroidobacteraceae bacterium]|nr:hypothetical protein [Steroidobacteraceae bacterium]